MPLPAHYDLIVDPSREVVLVLEELLPRALQAFEKLIVIEFLHASYANFMDLLKIMATRPGDSPAECGFRGGCLSPRERYRPSSPLISLLQGLLRRLLLGLTQDCLERTGMPDELVIAVIVAVQKSKSCHWCFQARC